MKNILYIALGFVGVLSFAQQTTDFFSASEVIWHEDFVNYANQTGVLVEGGVVSNSGDYDATFSKWTIDASAINASAEAKATVINMQEGVYVPSFSVENTGGEVVWESEEIDVSNLSNTYISLLLAKQGDLTANDYIDVYWRLADYSYILIDENTIGHTITGEDMCWDTKKIQKDLTATTPTTLRIKVVFNSSAANKVLMLRDVMVTGAN